MRNLYNKLMLKLLMLVHDKAEDVWHWAWSKSRKYADEKPRGFVGGTYSCRIVQVNSGLPRLYSAKDGLIKPE